MNIDYELISKNLNKNNINTSFVATKDKVLDEILKLIQENSSVYTGGSTSLIECGVIDFFRNSVKYEFHDRSSKNITSIEKDQMSKEAFTSDCYLASANAITIRGQIYEVDNIGNRVAAIMYGPKKVILVVGRNKIVETLNQAVERVKSIAAPKNTLRLNRETYCKKHGKCFMTTCDTKNLMTVPAGTCPNTICSSSTIFSYQYIPNRLHVILVDEELGY